MTPDEWLCAVLSAKDLDKAFKLLSTDPSNVGVVVRVLHKESGAVWKFRCVVEREGVK